MSNHVSRLFYTPTRGRTRTHAHTAVLEKNQHTDSLRGEASASTVLAAKNHTPTRVAVWINPSKELGTQFLHILPPTAIPLVQKV